MSGITLNSNTDSINLSVPKLHDDGSNWADYEPQIQKAMGSKGLWRHVEGTAITPKLYAMVNQDFILSDGKTPAIEKQIEARETQIINYEKWKYLAQHVILLTTLTCLGGKIKDLKSAKDMWDVVKADATTRSTLFLLDTEDQLASMKLVENDDPKAHLSELMQHFQLMVQCCNNLIKMGSTLSDTLFNIIIMSSLPNSYQPNSS